MSLAEIRPLGVCHASFGNMWTTWQKGEDPYARAAQWAHTSFSGPASLSSRCSCSSAMSCSSPRSSCSWQTAQNRRRATKCVFAHKPNRRVGVLESEHDLPHQVCEVLLRQRMRLVSMPLLSKHKGHRSRCLRVRAGSGDIRISTNDCRQPRRRHCATCEPLSPNSGRNSLSEDSESYRVCGFPLSMPETNFLAMHQCTGTFPTLSKRATAQGHFKTSIAMHLCIFNACWLPCHTCTPQLLAPGTFGHLHERGAPPKQGICHNVTSGMHPLISRRTANAVPVLPHCAVTAIGRAQV